MLGKELTRWLDLAVDKAIVIIVCRDYVDASKADLSRLMRYAVLCIRFRASVGSLKVEAN